MRGIALAIILSGGFIELAIRGDPIPKDSWTLTVIFLVFLLCLIFGW